MNNNETEANAILNAEDLPDKVNVIGVSFRDSGKIYYFAANGTVAKEGTGVIVETARGIEYGRVTMANKLIPKTELVLPLKKVLRAANDEDRAHLAENRQKEDEAFRLCQQKIVEHKLEMKLIEAEYTFDNAKLLFYFTSEDRVDFRELVKDLAGIFRTRIELRQIGIRDETKLMGGLGVCFREYCCHSFLGDFAQVSIKMAKEQGLSLNSAKISGACGRLMCCLRFEHETYQEEIKRTPKVGTQIVTPDGTGTVIESKPLMALVKVRLDADPEGAPKIYDRELVRLKTDQDETTKRGEKVERSTRPAFVPFTPLDSEREDKNESGQEKGKSSRRGKDNRKGENRRSGEDRRSGDRKNAQGDEENRASENKDRPRNDSGKGGKQGSGKNSRPGQQGKPGQGGESGEKQKNPGESKGQNRSAQNNKNRGGQGGAEQGSENRKKPHGNEKSDKYMQPPKSGEGEPTLRADLTESQEKSGENRKRYGRNHGRRPRPERKSENPTKKSENS